MHRSTFLPARPPNYLEDLEQRECSFSKQLHMIEADDSMPIQRLVQTNLSSFVALFAGDELLGRTFQGNQVAGFVLSFEVFDDFEHAGFSAFHVPIVHLFFCCIDCCSN